MRGAVTRPENQTCQNPDDKCAATSVVRWSPTLKLCKRCYQRFVTHGDGRKLRPWGTRFEKKER